MNTYVDCQIALGDFGSAFGETFKRTNDDQSQVIGNRRHSQQQSRYDSEGHIPKTPDLVIGSVGGNFSHDSPTHPRDLLQAAEHIHT